MKARQRGAVVVAVLMAAGWLQAQDVPTAENRRAEADRLYGEVELAAAAEIYAELAESSPHDTDLRIRLAECLTRTDRFEEAMDHAQVAVELTGGSAAALAELGLALHREGDFDAAEERLRRATETDESCARCWWGLARVVAIRSEYEEAAGYYQRAAALEPENPIYLRSLAPFVTERDKRKELYRSYLELPRAEEMPIWGNVRTWLAMLEYAGDRRLNQVEIPDEGAQVRMEEQNGMTYISVDVGSRKKRRYLFDTGASGFTISTGLMRRLKLEPVDVFTITGIGGEGLAKTLMVLVGEVRVGDAVVRNVPAVVRDVLPLVDGLMGPTFFGGASVLLDHEGGWVRIGGSAEEGEDPEAAGRKRKRKRKAKQVPRESLEIPFLSINGTPFIPLQVDGVTMNAMVDTGASQASLSRYAAEQVPGLELLAPSLAPPAYREIRGSTGRSPDVRVVRRARLEFAGKTLEMASHIPDRERILVRQDLASLSHGFGTEVWAILGNPQLESFNLLIDWHRQVLVMTRFR
jgi:predicted aspartyl protease